MRMKGGGRRGPAGAFPQTPAGTTVPSQGTRAAARVLFVWVGEGDLRLFLAYGPEPRKQCAAQQTFGRSAVSDC